MTTKEKKADRGGATRDALIATALEIFGRDGFHRATTRDIARASGINQALIGYHFRNKEGLYLAVFEHISEQFGRHLGPIADDIEAELAGVSGEGEEERRRLFALLLRIVDGFLALLTSEGSAAWAQLIVREQQAPTAAFTIFYERIMGRVLDLMIRLLQRLDDRQNAGDPRLLMVTILGQLLVFRVARAGVLRQMQWSRIGPQEVATIRAQVHRNLHALLSVE